MEVRQIAWMVAAAGLGLGSSVRAQDDGTTVTDDGSVVQPQPATNQPTRQPVNRPGGRQPGARPATAGGQPALNPPGRVQPGEGEGGAVQPESLPQPEGDAVLLSAFSEGVDIRTLVEYVAGVMKVNVAVDPSLSGSVVLNAPVRVPMDSLLVLLNALLEQNNFAMTHDALTGWYRVVPQSSVPVGLSPGPLGTTVVIRTPNLRPSTVKAMLDLQMINQVPRVVAMDDIGILVATDTPGRLRMIQDLVDTVIASMDLEYIRFELRFVSAADARKRALELIGRLATGVSPDFAGNAAGGAPRGTLDNLDERLIVAPQGNALIFRGREEEGAHVRGVLDVIDAPGNLVGKQYATGSSTRSIAAVAETTGLGSVMKITAEMDPNQLFQQQINQAALGQLGLQQASGGGSRLVVDEQRGVIVYYGTPDQQEEFSRLVEELDLGSDVVVIRQYRLRHRKAEEVQELLQALITGQKPPTEEGGLLPSAGNVLNPGQPQPAFVNQAVPEGAGVSLEGAEGMFAIADVTNNQLLVRAPLKLHDQFERLIDELDRRRPQAYLQAQVVAVTWTDTQRLAFETQLINAAGHGGALQTNFGLSNAGATFVDPRTVATGLAGITGAVIRSEYVPIIINALTTEADGRVLSTPRLLVNDNKKATLDSKDLQPTTSLSQGDQSTLQSFSGYEEAGTIMEITPQISDGYINLDFMIELSSFTGPATDVLPPPKQENKITTEQVSVPAGRTVVVGGITLDSETNRVRKIPILGDLPFVGVLFRDTALEGRSTTLYVFVTPEIAGEANFEDLFILAKGPQEDVALSPRLPVLEPQIIPINPGPVEVPARSRPGEVIREGSPSGG